MPVIVIGADTHHGRAIVEGLIAPGREVRAFVSESDVAADLRRLGVKVAHGDVSDDSHVQAAATGCFTAVLVAEAARDGRERSFASTETQVLVGWANAVAASGVSRVIWVGDELHVPVETPEVATVSSTHPDLVSQVVMLDNASTLAPRPNSPDR